MPTQQISVRLALPFVGEIAGVWEPDRSERDAAWEMYVELVTRVSVVDLHDGEGSLREAMTSIYSLFESTRKILRTYGPTVARPKKGRDLSFGLVAVTVLNTVIRPFLTRWHPALQAYEAGQTGDISPVDREAAWADHDEARAQLTEMRHTLLAYADLLSEVAGVPSLVTGRPAQDT